jgi:hypothetical protein
MKPALIAAVALCAVVASGLPSDARKTAAKPTPAPTSAAPMSVPEGYYIMKGPYIIGPRYGDVAACYKALAALKSTLEPGSESIACVHRLY